ncbi:MAG: hypothetical protein RL291_616 [Pseudomonadota bacterium]
MPRQPGQKRRHAGLKGPGLSDAARQRIYAMLGARSPRTAVRALYRDFCTPPRFGPGAEAEARLVEKMTPLFARAEQRFVPMGRQRVATYLWKPSARPAVGRVLLVHGWTGRAMIMGLFVEPLLRAGYEVVALDFPAHGRSTGQRLNMPIGKEAILAVGAELGPFTAAISHSFGGPVLALVTDEGPPLPRSLRFDRLVLIASPNRLTAMIDAFARRFALPLELSQGLAQRVEQAAGRPLADVAVDRFLPASRVPTLLIRARDDEDVPYERATTILAQSPNAHLLSLDGLGHRHIVISSTVVRAAIGFIGGKVPDGAESGGR